MTNSLNSAIKLNQGKLIWYKIYFSDGTMIRKYDNFNALVNKYKDVIKIEEVISNETKNN